MRQALVAGDRQGAHARRARLQVSHRSRQHVKHIVHLARNQVSGGGAAAAVRDVHGEGASSIFHQLTGQVVGPAGAGRGVAQFARVALGKCEHLLEGLELRFLGADHHDDRALFDQGHRDQIGHGIKRYFGHHRLVYRQRCEIAQTDGVAVGRCFGHRIGADIAACAGLVVHHHGLAEIGAELLRDLPRARITAAAGRIGHDKHNGLARPVCSGVLRH